RILIHDCLIFASTQTGVSIKDILGPSLLRSVVEARHLGMWLARKYTTGSLQSVTNKFGRTEHTTVRNAVSAVKRKKARSKTFAAQLEEDELAFMVFARAAAERRAAATQAAIAASPASPATQPETAP
ncbi:MAG: helix-turn-helix domain-containing protein, partial [Hyphomicrobiaceae bacterium]